MCIRKKFIKYVGLYGLILLLMLKYIRCMETALQVHSNTNTDNEDDGDSSSDSFVLVNADSMNGDISTTDEDTDEDNQVGVNPELTLHEHSGRPFRAIPTDVSGPLSWFRQQGGRIKKNRLTRRILSSLKVLLKGIFVSFYGPLSLLFIGLFLFPSLLSIALIPVLSVVCFVVSLIGTFAYSGYKLFSDEPEKPKKKINLEKKAAKLKKYINKHVKNKKLYKILGVPTNVDTRTLKAQYQRLSLKFHPDKNRSPNAAEKFKLIKAAYEILADEDQRLMYDRFGRTPDYLTAMLDIYKYVQEGGGDIVIRDGSEDEEEEEQEQEEDEEEDEDEDEEDEEEKTVRPVDAITSYTFKQLGFLSNKLGLYLKIIDRTSLAPRFFIRFPLNILADAAEIAVQQDTNAVKEYQRLQNEEIILAADKLRKALKESSLLMSDEEIEEAAPSSYSLFLLRMAANTYYAKACSFLSDSHFRENANSAYYELKLLKSFVYGQGMQLFGVDILTLNPNSDPVFSAMLMLMKPQLEEIIDLALDDKNASDEERRRRAKVLKDYSEGILRRLNKL